MAKANMTPTKQPMPEQDPMVRCNNLKEVALGYTEEMAVEEVTRRIGRKTSPVWKAAPF